MLGQEDRLTERYEEAGKGRGSIFSVTQSIHFFGLKVIENIVYM